METTHATRKGTHKEHVFLLEELHQLEWDVVGLQCFSEVSAEKAAAQELEQISRHLSEWLPQHFRREEETLFAKAARISPELEDFCRLMRDEHAELLGQLRRLCEAIDALQRAEGVNDTIYRVKKEAKEFTLRLRDHVALEEEEFRGFL
jgi:iron-sulfur cluster repair protein YtfE (RIC family)